MKILKLTMSAFGPFAKETVIDFTQLGENGIYLITGDTGAGKTMIFDAICYALYGKASGNDRQENMFRCNFVNPEKNIPTFVELEFEYKGEKYKVHRQPKSNPEEDTKEIYELTLPDNKIITGSRIISNKISEILGVNQEQFKQIVMIAQGDFRKLITTSTLEREQILQTIFGTEKYKSIENQIKNDYNLLKKNINETEKNILDCLNDFIFSEDNEFSQQIQQLNQDNIKADTENILQICKCATEEEIKKSKECDKDFTDADKKLLELKGELERAKNQAEIRNSLAQTQKNIEIITPQVKQAEEKFETEKNNIPQSEKLTKEIAQYENLRGNYLKVEEIINDAKVQKNNAEENEKLFNSTEAEIEKIKNELSETKKYAEEIKDCDAKKIKIETQLKDTGNLINELEKLLKNLSELENKNSNIENAQKDFETASEKYNIQSKKYIDMEISFYKNQAGLLAKDLKDGLPCPVCGSEIHPQPAKFYGEEISKETLDNEKKICKTFEKKMQSASDTVKTLNIEYRTQEKNAIELKEKTLGECLFENAESCANAKISEKKKEYKNLETEYSQVEKQIKDKKNLEEKIKNLEEKAQQKTKESSEYKNKATAFVTAYNEKIKSSEDMKKTLPFETKEEFEKNLTDKKDKKNALENAYKQAETVLNNLQKKLDNYNTEYDSLKNQLKDDVKADLEKLVEETNLCEKTRQELSQKRDNFTSIVTTNENTMKKLKNLIKECEKNNEKSGWLDELYKITTGLKSINGNVNLETYVQMNYFEKILQRANVRLMKMTGGKFELFRTNEQNKNSKSGLEINVYDHFIGKFQPVKSVSGGESFMISLSLALGLSDEIQYRSSGIQLDSMFIDEGFGTLDEKLLPETINALSGLAEGNRIVGIISHISELKERISKQIVVKKDEVNGSSVEIIT